MRVRAESNFKVGRWCAEGGRHYEVSERAAYVVANGWATELPADDPNPFEAIPAELLSPDAPRPATENVTLDVQSVQHGVQTNTQGDSHG